MRENQPQDGSRAAKKNRPLDGGRLLLLPVARSIGLKSLWDEICVQQIEAELSDCWEYFEAEVERLIEPEIEKLPEPVKKAIWLQTEEGWKVEDEDVGEFLIATSELASYIAEDYVFEKARSWSNRQINYYIHGEYGSLFYSR